MQQLGECTQAEDGQLLVSMISADNRPVQIPVTEDVARVLAPLLITIRVLFSGPMHAYAPRKRAAYNRKRTAYNHFVGVMLRKFAAENTGMSRKDRVTKASRAWSELSETEKDKYMVPGGSVRVPVRGFLKHHQTDNDSVIDFG